MKHISLYIYLFVLYWALVAFLSRRGILERYNITAWGPVLMVRTMRGQGFLDFLGRAKLFWRAFASIGIPVMFIGMLSMLAIVVLADYVLITQLQSGTIPEPGKFNEPRNIFLIPGLSEFIPLTWGLLGLAVTLIVHEFSHAVLCKVEGVRVKSMGILLAPIPIGGFAEPDEEQLMGKSGTGGEKVASKAERMRILSAGVMSNFVTALIAFMIFFAALGLVAPSERVMVVGVEDETPADAVGLEPGMAITHVNGARIESAGEFILRTSGVDPDSEITLRVLDDGSARNISMPPERSDEGKESGLVIDSVVRGSAAESGGLTENMVLKRIDERRIGSFADFASFMEDTRAGQTVQVEVFNTTSNRTQVFNITLGAHPDGSQKGFLGISPRIGRGLLFNGATIGEFPAREYLQALQRIPSKLRGIEGWFIIFTLPIMGLGGEGFPSHKILVNFYEPIGAAEPFGDAIFWIISATLWIAWINFYVGLFNCLPAVPLDGGHVFKDALGSIFNLRLKDRARSEELSRKIVTLFAVTIFSSFFLMIAIPWIVHSP
ncbi:Peptidase family M50 [Candidatus Methanoperedenaceae archaeon GB50]|nr:Peptidase family M50 [Candidatus Methanoperedenaceae archaeon GB50]CAD7781024.1 MAG: Peptidase family M50 [Candidatus Methanoperedenaceae archaeon GB50]